MDERAQRLSKALAEVLNAIEAHEESRMREDGKPKGFSILKPFQAFTMTELEENERLGEFFLTDPIGYGLRKSVRKIGQLLARDFPKDMLEIAEKAADDPAGRSYGIRVNIVDKHWDGLSKSDGDVWVA
jgi:hypothetical protein